MNDTKKPQQYIKTGQVLPLSHDTNLESDMTSEALTIAIGATMTKTKRIDNPEYVARLKALRAEGKSQQEIAKILDIPSSGIGSDLRAIGIYGINDKLAGDLENIAALYGDWMGITTLARKFEVSYMKMRSFIEKHGLTRNDHSLVKNLPSTSAQSLYGRNANIRCPQRIIRKDRDNQIILPEELFISLFTAEDPKQALEQVASKFRN